MIIMHKTCPVTYGHNATLEEVFSHVFNRKTGLDKSFTSYDLKNPILIPN